MTLSSLVASAAGTFAIKTADRALDKASEKIVQSLGDYALAARNKIVAEFRIGFQTFMQNSYERCRTYKTLLNPYAPLPVLDKYIHTNVDIGGKVFSDKKLIAGIRANTRVIISGLAGSGKSMLMKYLTLTLSDAGHNLLPLFIELRRFNSESKKSLKTLILDAMSNDATKITEEQFNVGLKAGVFALILDGFDELNEEIAENIEREIIEFSMFHPNVALVVSSRPSRRFEAWEKFYSARVMPLDLAQTSSLINSFNYDDGVKTRFLKRVEDGLWKTHDSFLSSPLLCTIMMLTFEEFAEIPTKMHAFYGQAFDTLFQRHDALKYQFTRETKTKMTKDLFKRCLSAFCVTSYLDEVYLIKPEDAARYATAAIKYVRQSTGAPLRGIRGEDFVDDLEHVVNILQPDGLDLSFVHRSFQEYFAALFAVNYHDSKFAELLDRFSRRYADAAVAMAFDMAREKVETEWVRPKIEALIEKMENAKTLGEKVQSFYGNVNITRSRLRYYLFTDYNSDGFGVVYCLGKLYPRVIPPNMWFLSVDRAVDKKVIQKINLAGNEEGMLFQSWASQTLEKGQVSRFTVNMLEDNELAFKELGFEAPFEKFLDGAPKILEAIDRRGKRRSDVIDKFL